MLDKMVSGGSMRCGRMLTTPPVSRQISDAVYRMVYEQTKAQYDAVTAKCEQERPQMESTIRTDMDQIITSKEHLASKIRGTALWGDALSQEVGAKVGSDTLDKAIRQDQVQYRPRAPCKNQLHCFASLGHHSWWDLGRGPGPCP